MPATVLVICSSLEISSGCCCSRKKLEKETWYVFFLKDALQVLACCYPRGSSAERLVWEVGCGEGPPLSAEPPFNTNPPQARKQRLPRGIAVLNPWAQGPSFNCILTALVSLSLGGGRRWFSWSCSSCSWMALACLPEPLTVASSDGRTASSEEVCSGELKTTGQTERKLYLSAWIFILTHL